MAYEYISPAECLGDSLFKINNNASNFDTRIDTLSGRTPTRAFYTGGTDDSIWIDSGFLGNDATADGTPTKPFKTIAAAVTYYYKSVYPKGVAARFRLSPGTSTVPKIYKGAHVYLSGCVFGSSVRNADNASIGNPYTYPGGDRTIYFIGDVVDPRTVVIEPIFSYSRGTGIDYWNSHGLLIDAPEGSIVVQGISFRYNAVGNLPGYTGSNQFYNDKTDISHHLLLNHCHYARVEKCIFEQMIDPNLYDVMQAGWSWAGGSISQPSAKYMLGIGFYNCRFARISEITVTGTMRYIAKSAGSELAFEQPGQITLQNNPRFYGMFEVEGGGVIICDKVYPGTGYNDPNYSLRFVGSCGSTITTGGKQWYNYTFLNFESKGITPGRGAIPQHITWPSQGATPAFQWPTNVTRRSMWVDTYYTQTGINNNVFYIYSDSGRTPGTGNPRNV